MDEASSITTDILEILSRAAVKRAMDIVIHLQATLQMDIGGTPAEALAEFYTAIFALVLQGSQSNSRKKFEQVIVNVQNVREAWRQVARGPDAVSSVPSFGGMFTARRRH
jgi:flagellar secretion chaperone FliS